MMVNVAVACDSQFPSTREFHRLPWFSQTKRVCDKSQEVVDVRPELFQERSIFSSVAINALQAFLCGLQIGVRHKDSFPK